MSLSRCILGLACLWHGVIASPLGAVPSNIPIATDLQTAAETVAQPIANSARKLHGKFLHITGGQRRDDRKFYKPHSSTDEADACHRGKGPAGVYGAEVSDCDSPFALVNATFDWIAANVKDDIDFVIWTGDTARHDSDEGVPRNADQVLGTNRWIADKMAELFSDSTGRHLEIPIVPTLGNNDILPHNILLPGPNSWLQHYTHIWRRFVPEAQRHSFQFGGWFYVEVIPNRLAIFSLNTLYFFDRNAGTDGCASPSEPGYKQMEWLRIQLQIMRERGMKAILMGHVPPARTDSKKLWDENCWQKYSLWLRQYRDVVVSGVFGHMNIDHFFIHDERDINVGQLAGLADNSIDIREAMDDELSVTGAADYLQELRQNWAKLQPPPTDSKNSGQMKKGKKGRKGKKKKPDLWGERYSLSLVSPSIVPNYYPALRIVEYNISGLEDTPVWRDAAKDAMSIELEQNDRQKHLDLKRRHSSHMEDDDEIDAQKKKGKKNKGGDSKPKKPDFLIPHPPAKSSPPGPAYSPQPLTLTGYTQYFANLTHINNITTEASSALLDHDEEEETWVDWLLRWRKGKHGNRKPIHPAPDPREFHFEVEYSTFDDKLYKLSDLTVKSYVELAYRISKQPKKGKAKSLDDVSYESAAEEEEEEEEEEGDLFEEVEEADDEEEQEDVDLSDGEEVDDDSDEDELETETFKNHDRKKKKKKKKKGKKRQNKVWMHFLTHAFVSTVEKEDLKKFT
ncbi:Metallo-dependent phosphatase-like protein [Neurospora hispaniola]|uniref:Endopolyphosphatase n=1 Tax=Neurospora hispaniola TaxID=588809 RepID=A0AAJ0MU90_9PEZI|nr:Metallo-dependent phosphatase-like protein [Neurospora hispaniola]